MSQGGVIAQSIANRLEFWQRECVAMKSRPGTHQAVSDTLDGQAARFATTQWTMVLTAGADGPGRTVAMERLCRLYWKPIYAFVRTHGRKPEDAADLTQSFFAKLIANDGLAGLQREGARFSTFLLTGLKNHVRNQHEKEMARRRGGGAVTFSLDEAHAESWYGREPTDGRTPEQAFERGWAVAMMESAMETIRLECESAGKGELFALLSPFLSREPERGEYDRVSEVAQMKPGTVAVSVHRLRLRFRDCLRAALAEGGDPDDELRHLRRVLSLT